MSWLVPLDIGMISGLIFAWAVLALAMAFRLLSFPDLTVEGSLPLGAAVYAVMLKAGWPIYAATASALGAGALAGMLTAVLHVRFNVNKFLAGIIVIAIAYTGCLRIMGASNIGLLQFETLFGWVSGLDVRSGRGFHAGTLLLLASLAVVGGALLLAGLTSRQGLRMRVAGVNPEHAQSLGISVAFNLVAGLAITNSLAALSGVLLANHQGFSDVAMGQGVLILALAAMAIGERVVPGRRLAFPSYVVLAAIGGSIIYQIVVAYAVRAGVPATDLKLLTAVLVLVVVARSVSRDTDDLLGSV